MNTLWKSILASVLLASPASAALVSFNWSTEINSTVSSSPIPGVSSGDEVNVQVLVDNGNSSLISQSWFLSDIVAVHLTVGTYSATYTSAFLNSGPQPVFTTDSSGELASARFFGTGVSPANTDNFGSGARLIHTEIRSSQDGVAYFVDRLYGPDPTEMIGWDPNPTIIPEPSPATLLIGLSLAGLRRRG